jgi:Xaa-Pro aminopeptidase
MLTLTASGCAARREQLIKTIEGDLLIITNPQHILYLTGVYISQMALSAFGPNHLLIDTQTGKSTLLLHNFISGARDQAHVDAVEVWRWYDAETDAGVDPYSRGVDELNARIAAYSGKRIGSEKGWLPHGANVTQPVDISETLRQMRRVKYDDELALIREAVAVNEAGHRAAREMVAPGVSELDVYNAAQTAMVKQAGAAVHLMGDFASGGRSGGVATNYVLQPKDTMILDMFPVVNGYRADFTCTLAVDRKPTEKARALETALHEALAAGEQILKPGTKAKDVHAAVKNALAKHGFAEGFRHHAGHGLGLGHPEAPYFVPNSEEVIVAGDVVTLEPGSYGKDFAARIEHNYHITETGFERLSHHLTTLA